MRTYESHNSEFANWSFSVTAPKFQPLKKKKQTNNTKTRGNQPRKPNYA